MGVATFLDEFDMTGGTTGSPFASDRNSNEFYVASTASTLYSSSMDSGSNLLSPTITGTNGNIEAMAVPYVTVPVPGILLLLLSGGLLLVGVKSKTTLFQQSH